MLQIEIYTFRIECDNTLNILNVLETGLGNLVYVLSWLTGLHECILYRQVSIVSTWHSWEIHENCYISRRQEAGSCRRTQLAEEAQTTLVVLEYVFDWR